MLRLFAVLLAVVMLSAVFEHVNHINHMFKEAVAIPLQQIAATVCQNGEITDEQLEFIDQVMPIDFIQENYDPYTVDALKWGDTQLDNKFLNEHKGPFLNVWAQMLVPNFKTYVKAYLQETHWFWATTHIRPRVYYALFLSEEWLSEMGIHPKSVLPAAFQDAAEEAILPTLYAFPSEGQLIWLTMFILLILGNLHGGKSYLVGAAVLGGWLTVMISVPIATSFRYILYLPLTLQLLIGMFFIRWKNTAMAQGDSITA